ncbi:hypothetical protein F5B22DRAFT_627821 [Xylaria bambusicola]|uniref:uncharacterized protein n=1 Tax=Xylaria bambusicola TaxID=326684 RepID=UPI0020088509|nr:uncharacterized protein F5B22DRAFT_627821 [Xylaria bambusicola]KAI0505461.1 hypothetical protein F5B22DRAFT_627821 [Xylaria bambusicola]
MAEGVTAQARLAVAIVGLVIALSSTALRFWFKLSLKKGFQADDGWALLGILAYIAGTTADIWGLFNGDTSKQIIDIVAELLKNPTPAKVKTLENYLKALFIGYYIAPFGLTSARLSLILLYRQIFATPKYRVACTIAIMISALWWVSAVVVNSILCIPISKLWKRLEPGHCLNFNLYFLVIGILETTIDLYILAIPINAISTLHMQFKMKLIASTIFLLGTFTIVTNILRMKYIYSPSGGIDVSLSASTVWTHAHCATAVLCANLPVYKPLGTMLSNLYGVMSSFIDSPLRFIGKYTSKKTISASKNLGDNLQIIGDPPKPSHGPGFYTDELNSNIITDSS